jgi:hypothetical protein
MKVDTKNFQRFLRKRGWAALDQRNKNIVYLASPKDTDGDWHSVVLPSDMALGDAPERIDAALNLVADATQIPKPVLSRTIERWDRDIINTRLDSRRNPISSIPLSLATLIVEDLRAFLGYAAYSQVSPAKFFAKAGKIATDFTASCSFGHTYEGSFGMVIECPLSNVRQLAISEDLVDPPFERLVTMRIAEGYRQIQLAKDSDDPTSVLKGYETGMNANMLRALIDIYENLDPSIEIEYSVNWAPELSPPHDLLQCAPLKFDGRAHEISRFAAEELEREDEETQTTIVSFVVSLKSETPLSEELQDEFDHVITLHWEREAEALIRIRVALPAGEYKKACDAHKNGRKIIVSGIPEKEGKFWYLTRPSEIQFAV